MPDSMKACQIIEFNQPHQIRTIPTPSAKGLKKYDLLIKVAVPALCHSDLEYLKGVFPIKLPVTASHEGTGTVIAFGSGVERFKPGDRVVAGQTFGRCGDCEICNGPENYRHYCPNREPMMSVDGRNGAFQEFLIVDGREATKIPEKMSFATAAPLACAGMTSWRAVKQAGLKPGEWLGIIGSGGGLGHLGIQFAKKAFGLKVVGVDARDEGLALTKEMGADLVIDARKGKEAMVEEVNKATEKGVSAVLELSGHPTAAETGGAITRNHGKFIQVAIVRTSHLVVVDMMLTINRPTNYPSPCLIYCSRICMYKARLWRLKWKQRRCSTRLSNTRFMSRITSSMVLMRFQGQWRC